MISKENNMLKHRSTEQIMKEDWDMGYIKDRTESILYAYGAKKTSHAFPL